MENKGVGDQVSGIRKKGKDINRISDIEYRTSDTGSKNEDK